MHRAAADAAQVLLLLLSLDTLGDRLQAEGAGETDVDWVLARKDDDGKLLGEELARIGYAGDAPVGGRPLDAYFELHIEQGPILDEQAVDVGIVTKGYAVRGYIVEVQGETAHTGPWPTDKRRNALVGAALLAVAANDVGWKYHATGGKATVSRLLAWPNKPGMLSDWAQVTVDVRHESPETADRMARDLLDAIPACARLGNVRMKMALSGNLCRCTGYKKIIEAIIVGSQ